MARVRHLKDRNVNDLVTAIILGFSTVLFIMNVASVVGNYYELYGSSSAGTSSPFPWRTIVTEVVGYVVAILVAMIVRMQLAVQPKQ